MLICKEAMKNNPVIIFAIALLCVAIQEPTRAQNANELRIGFELPADDRQADAAHAVAGALTKRNVETTLPVILSRPSMPPFRIRAAANCSNS
jgi:hypothetical protein